MQEFSQEALASRLLSRNELAAADIEVLAAKVAAFHATIEIAKPDSAFGRPDEILRIALQNFAQIRPILGDACRPGGARRARAMGRARAPSPLNCVL